MPGATLVNKLNRREQGAVWSMDVSQEDTVLAVSYESSKVELIDLLRAKAEVEELADPTVSVSNKYVMNSYKTKQSTAFCLKFSYENLLLAVALFAPDSK